MAEELLDRPQVGPAFEQVRRERVAQAMRVGDEPAQRRRVEPAPGRGEEERVVRAARQLGSRAPEIRATRTWEASSPSGTTRSFAPLPWRMWTSSCSKSTSPRSRPTASALRIPAEYTSSTIARFRSSSAPAPWKPAISSSTSPAFGASGRCRVRRGRKGVSGTRSAPSEKRRSARTAASLREIVAGASFPPGRARPRSGHPVGEDADVDPLEVPAAVPGGEVAQVGCVGASGGARDARGREEPLAGGFEIHPARFASSLPSPPGWTTAGNVLENWRLPARTFSTARLC